MNVLECPMCFNMGWYPVGPEYGDQEQCEFCWSEPNSRFNLNIKLENIYIEIGEKNGKVPDELFDEANELEAVLNPLPEYDPPIEDFKCHCNRRDCWECVYKDDPMGI